MWTRHKEVKVTDSRGTRRHCRSCYIFLEYIDVSVSVSQSYPLCVRVPIVSIVCSPKSCPSFTSVVSMRASDVQPAPYSLSAQLLPNHRPLSLHPTARRMLNLLSLNLDSAACSDLVRACQFLRALLLGVLLFVLSFVSVGRTLRAVHPIGRVRDRARCRPPQGSDRFLQVMALPKV